MLGFAAVDRRSETVAIWLVSDGERLRRTTQPRTGRTPWIMPGELNQPELLALPPALAEKLRPEPVGPFPG